jgi:hypothetical protein
MSIAEPGVETIEVLPALPYAGRDNVYHRPSVV